VTWFTMQFLIALILVAAGTVGASLAIWNERRMQWCWVLALLAWAALAR
jgi:hypothetical protein